VLSSLAEMGDTSSETVMRSTLSIDIRTRDTQADDLIERTYTFSYAKEWDKWMFHEYVEERTDDTTSVSDREWVQTRHIFWDNPDDSPEIDVPQCVAQQLADATGSSSVTIQVPNGAVTDAPSYEEIVAAK